MACRRFVHTGAHRGFGLAWGRRGPPLAGDLAGSGPGEGGQVSATAGQVQDKDLPVSVQGATTTEPVQSARGQMVPLPARAGCSSHPAR